MRGEGGPLTVDLFCLTLPCHLLLALLASSRKSLRWKDLKMGSRPSLSDDAKSFISGVFGSSSVFFFRGLNKQRLRAACLPTVSTLNPHCDQGAYNQPYPPLLSEDTKLPPSLLWQARYMSEPFICTSSRTATCCITHHLHIYTPIRLATHID